MKENVSGNAIDQRIQTGQNTLSNWNVTEFLISIHKILSSARQGFFKNIHQLAPVDIAWSSSYGRSH